uniref:Protein kinase domain-containing protein n=1 Tax=Panagrolaimus sp. ES5 TaxID=591445 RepID=A0AC34F546_9BILA
MSSKTRIPNISAIEKEAITEISKNFWAPYTSSHQPYDAKVIDDIYENELKKTEFLKRKVVLLEFSQYLERFLWPNFDPSSSNSAHILSIIVMVNEKFRERVPAWNCFVEKPENFPAFFHRVLELALSTDEIGYLEQTAVLVFLVNAVNSIEIDLVRKEVVKLCSLNILSNLYPSQRTALLSSSPKLLKYWNKMELKFKELPHEQKVLIKFNRSVLWKLIQRFLDVLAFVDDQDSEFDVNAVRYLERFLEFSTDMISLLTTRRFFNQLIIASHLLVKCSQSDFIKTEVGALFCKLITRLKFYVRFEIDDVNGVALDENEMVQKHYNHVVNLQKAAFKFFRDRMSLFYLLSASSIDTPKVLSEQLSELDVEDLANFAEYLHLIPTKDEREAGEKKEYSKQFLIDIIVFHCERRPNQLQQLNEQPIYPSEKVIWDENLIPYEEYDSENVLALPKLNFQFLTLHDYLLRNFSLFQMESTYEIRHDIENSLYRMRPWQHEHGGDKVVWGGWARFSIPLTELRLVHVARPLIGQRAPDVVTADLTITLPTRRDLRQEWEGLHRHDILFLVTVVPLLKVGTRFDPRKPFKDQIKVAAVRGCEVDGLIDNDGKVIEEMEHRDALKNLTGDVRKYRIWLDPNQYFVDQSNDQGDIYYSLNLVIRRDPKTNNFKAVLSTIRQLLNTDFVVPDWLQDLILGYGEPDTASGGGASKNMAAVTERRRVKPAVNAQAKPTAATADSPKKSANLQPQPLQKAAHGIPGLGPEVPRGKNAPPHLNTGQILNGKFRIDKIIGSGGFGQIYSASDEVTRLAVAIKVVPADHEPGRMILEQKVLILLRGTQHAPHLIASGSFNGLMYIVMEMLGKNLGELRRKRKDRKLTISTVLRVGQQAISGLKAVHDVGYLHRDVKPSNMCIGVDGIHRRTIYVVDFGMTRQYRNQNGGFRKERAYAGFRGTMRYVSLTVHERKEQGPGDDMMSLLYTLIELAEGNLPWKHLSDPDDIAQKKRITTFEDMCNYFPISIKSFYQHLEKLQYHQMPDYQLLTNYLQKALPSNVLNESPFDWEETPSILKSVNKSKNEEESD